MARPRKSSTKKDQEEAVDQALEIWMKGYFTGIEQGIFSVGKLVEQAGEDDDSPFTRDCKKELAMMGRALKRQAKEMTYKIWQSGLPEDDPRKYEKWQDGMEFIGTIHGLHFN